MEKTFFVVQWLLPDDRVFENKISDVSQFVAILKISDFISIEAFSYKVVRIELILEEELWLSVLLERQQIEHLHDEMYK
jgi:hypothetical protein